MLQYIIKRALTALPTLIGVAIVVFLVVRIMPGDPAELMAGQHATAEDIQEMRVQLGLDRPIPVQMGIFLSGLARGDFGVSVRSGFPVLGEILTVLPNTLLLVCVSMILSAVIGILLGAVAASRQNTLSDTVAMFVAVIGVSMPGFWLALLLIILMSVQLGLLPSGGIGEIQHLIMPAFTMALSPMATIARQTRSAMLEVLRQDYIRTAYSKGVSRRVVIYKHALRPAMIPVATVIGTLFGVFLGGTLIVETVFSYPGMGRAVVDGLMGRDYPMVQGCVLTFAFMFIFINLVVDILYSYIDPRISYK